MKLNDKLNRVKTEVNNIATHDDAMADEVDHTLKEVINYVQELRTKTNLRRLGTVWQRVINFFKGFYKYLVSGQY